MNTSLIVSIIIILLLLYWLYKTLTTNYTTLGSMQAANNVTTLPADSLPKKLPINSSISAWFYVNDWTCKTSNASAKSIVAMKSSAGAPVFSINLGNCVNEIVVKVLCSTSSSTPQTVTCAVPDFPLQRWVNVIVSMNSNAVDIYLDGKLVKTCVLPAPAMLSTASVVTVGGGFDGFITTVKYKGEIINPEEAWNIYSDGYGGSPLGDLFNKYKLKLSFIVDNIEQSSVST